MRKNVLLVAGLCVLSTSAFASKARVEALGQNGYKGSYYINDARNIFRNAALVNQHKNYVSAEWGSAATTDAAATPRPEGGFFREMGTFTYGLYLGNDNNSVYSTAKGNNYLEQDNALDFFFGGDMGMQWGARLHYAASKDETAAAHEKKNNAFGLGLGAVHGDMSGYLNLDLSDKSSATTGAAGAQWKLKPSFEVGGSYKLNGFTTFANYTNYKYEDSVDAAFATKKGNSIEVGVGRIHEVSPTARVVTNASLVLAQAENENAAGKVKSQYIPVAIGFETDATSWLVLRAGVTQKVLINQDKDVNGKKATDDNTTNVTAGATLTFGKFNVDGLIGTTPASRTGTTVADDTNNGVLTTDNLMSRVGVTYNF